MIYFFVNQVQKSMNIAQKKERIIVTEKVWNNLESYYFDFFFSPVFFGLLNDLKMLNDGLRSLHDEFIE